MICPTCNEWDIGEPPWESWYQCANCDVHPETSLHMKAQRERIAALEAERDGLRAKLEAIKEAAAECAKGYRGFLGFGPSTRLELLLGDEQEGR